jgi:PTH1 family peptidyl-tRNA hydrolase
LKPQILFGLGNPGDEYSNTRHNMGENAVRAWAAKAGLSFESGDGPFIWTPVRRGVRAVIPTTYMNLSGKAVSKLAAVMEFGPKELLVVADDVWLELGRLRLRQGGSDGGHNGLKSIAEVLGTQGYPRLRMGVGPIPEHADWADFVLDPFAASEKAAVELAIKDTVAALGLILARGYSAAQNTINRTPDEIDDGGEKNTKK